MILLSADAGSIGAEIVDGETAILNQEDTNQAESEMIEQNTQAESETINENTQAESETIEQNAQEELETTEIDTTQTETIEKSTQTEVTEESTQTKVTQESTQTEIVEEPVQIEDVTETTDTVETIDTTQELSKEKAVYQVEGNTMSLAEEDVVALSVVASEIVITGTYEGEITLTIHHYNTEEGMTKELFLSDELSVKTGEKISDFYKYEEYYEIEKVTITKSDGTQQELTAENGVYSVEAVSESVVVNVYYKEETGNTFSSGVTMFDYVDGRATNTNSINYYKNYASYKSSSSKARPGQEDTDLTNDKTNWSKRFASKGAASDYQLMVKNTQNQTVNANAYNSSNDKQVIKGLLKNLSEDDYAKVNFTYEDPGFFTSESKAGKRVIDGYQLQFNRTGIRYELIQVFNAQSTIVYNKGEQFFPLKNETRLTGENQSSGNYNANNEYFGMRYDFEFVIGDYTGDMTYTFSGDDDLWVCLDGEVILDLGGIHGAVEGSVDIWKVLLGLEQEATYEMKAEYLSTGENKTRTHTITVLYMERGGNQSNCNMSFIMPNVVPKEPVVTEVPVAELQLIKKDADTNAGIVGVGFTIYEDASCTIVKKSQTVTDSEGKVSFSGLKEGTYYLKETLYDTQSYLAEDKVYTIVVELNEEKTTASASLFYNGTEVSKEGTCYEIYNTPYVSIEFSKVDGSTQIPIEGAEFWLYQETIEGTPLAVSVSDENGKVCFDKLTVGTYLVKEMPLGGYVEVENPWIVEIYYENGAYVQRIYETTYNALTLAWEKEGEAYARQIIENTKAVGSLTITKTVDRVDDVHGIATFLFKITCPDNSVCYRTISFTESDTKENEKAVKSVTISDLPLGTYSVEEVLPVLRYTKISPNESKITKTLTVDGIAFSFENSKTFLNYYSHADVLVNKVTFDRHANGSVTADLSVQTSSDSGKSK